MKYLEPTFTVPAVEKPPADCKHEWINEKRKQCVMCGAPVEPKAKEDAA